MSKKRRKKDVRPGTPRRTASESPVRAPASPNNALVPRNRLAAYCAFLLVLTAVIYSSIVKHPFVNYDDGIYIASNPHIQEGLDWKTLSWVWTPYYASNWHPLTWLVHAANFSLFGQNAGGHHLVSLLFHSINVVVLFLLLARATGATERSLLVAGVFAVHPLNVESVAWAAELKNVLCTLFFLLALAAYGWYCRRPRASRYIVVAFLFFLGLASKPMVITLPFILLLLDYWPLARIAGWSTISAARPVPQKPFWNLVLEKLPLVAMSAASAYLTFEAQNAAGSTRMIRVSLAHRIENAFHSYGIYLWKALWPAGLAPFYPFPQPAVNSLWGLVDSGATPAGSVPQQAYAVVALALAAVFLLAISVLVWLAHTEKPYLLVGWLWFLGSLVPVIGLVQVGGQAWADRYAYLPLLGIFLMGVWIFADFSAALRLRVLLRVFLAAILLAVLSIVALRQVAYWDGDYALWTHTLQVTADNVVAERNLSMELMRTSRWDQAATHLARATELDPQDGMSQVDLGAALAAQGYSQEAIDKFEMARQRYSDPLVLSAACRNLGLEYHKKGSVAKAEEYYREALRLNPKEAAAASLLEVLMKQKVRESSRP